MPRSVCNQTESGSGNISLWDSLVHVKVCRGVFRGGGTGVRPLNWANIGLYPHGTDNATRLSVTVE